MFSGLYSAPRRALVVSVVVAAVCVTVGSLDASAAKGGKGGGGGTGSASGMTLYSETVQNSPNTATPLWCLNEDDLHKRMWTGSLNGSFTATERLCGTSDDYSNGMYWNAGGIGLQAELWVNGTVDDATITSPAGDSRHVVLVGSSTSKGVTTNHYQACYTPQYSVSSGASGRPLPGGTWQITVTGNFTNATFATTARMTTVAYQQAYCPASEQNLTA